MSIRDFQNNDKGQIISLMSEFGDYLEKLDPMNRTDFAENGAEYFTDKLLADTRKNNGTIYVAEEKGLITGFIGGYVAKQREEELMEAKKAMPGVISEFFVTQKYRSQGIGKLLLDKMENYFKNIGCTLIKMEVFAPNTFVRDFYSRHGYQDRSIIVSKDI